jgi:hypothetical protein
MSRKVLFLFLIPLLSCNPSISNFSIQPVEVDKPILISDIGESLGILEVQTPYPISGTPSILKSNRYYYLFEQGIVSTLHQVGLDGKLIRSIDFGYDDKLNSDGITQVILRGNQVGVVSRGSSVIWFDENLEELETEKLPIKAHFHYPLDAENLISYNNRINDLENHDILITQNGKLKRALPIRNEEYNFVYKSYSPFSEWNGQVLFSQAFNDTIYTWDQEVFKPRFLEIQLAMDMLAFFNERKYSYLQGEVYGLDPNRILFQINEKGKQKLGLMNLQENQLTIHPGIVDNSVSGMPLYYPQFSQDGVLYFGISGEQLLENYEGIFKSFKHRLSTNYAESFFIYKLKVKS